MLRQELRERLDDAERRHNELKARALPTATRQQNYPPPRVQTTCRHGRCTRDVARPLSRGAPSLNARPARRGAHKAPFGVQEAHEAAGADLPGRLAEQVARTAALQVTPSPPDLRASADGH